MYEHGTIDWAKTELWKGRRLTHMYFSSHEYIKFNKEYYKIEDEDFILIIDTTGAVTTLDEYNKGILLLKDKVIYKESEYKTETYNLANVDELRIDENFMNVLKRNIVWILFPFMLIGIFIYFCIARFLQIFIFSLVSLATSSISGIKLNYKQLFNIGVYAVTPSMLLGGLLALFTVQLPLFGLLYSGIYIAYIILGILNCKEAPAQPVQENIQA